ncbi:DoxX family protein [Tenacibaculum caenipelagi]|uniref:DoxX-like protein n=1 Tax=Tenacibaculum caenipelagi TaxID=1325435 RepID=A0A4R6TH27_9FLAO|nr:DoxX family protein [Tenacibaculum caenipelagi]TDQ27602.1 DoxX-like protein [Tenacibaculum caenipelagi]
MKRDKIIFYVSTGLLTLMMLMSAGMYIFNNEAVSSMFTAFGYPTYIIYPYAIAKILGLVALWFFRGKFLNEWAYAGFFFAFILAFFAHFMIGDGEQTGAVIAMVLLILSYIYKKKI